MKRTLSSLLLSLVIAATSIAPASSFAFSNNFSDLFKNADEKKAGGKGAAAQKAKAKYGGKVLSVSESKRDGKSYYKVKLLLDSGRIKIVNISNE